MYVCVTPIQLASLFLGYLEIPFTVDGCSKVKTKMEQIMDSLIKHLLQWKSASEVYHDYFLHVSWNRFLIKYQTIIYRSFILSVFWHMMQDYLPRWKAFGDSFDFTKQNKILKARTLKLVLDKWLAGNIFWVEGGGPLSCMVFKKCIFDKIHFFTSVTHYQVKRLVNESAN